MTIPPNLTHSLTPLNFNFISAELYHSVIQTHPTVPEKKYESDEKRLNHLEMFNRHLTKTHADEVRNV